MQESPPEPVGIGIVGTGRWARAHARAAARSRAISIRHCASRTADAREAFANEFGIPRQSSGIDSLLEDPTVDAVVIATPNHVHAEHARRAVGAGRPTLVDKPVATDLASGLDLLRLAQRLGVAVGVAHHARRLAGIRSAKRWLSEAGTGQVRLAYGHFSNARGAEMKEDAWYPTSPGAEAGVLIQVGIHQIENLHWLLGPTDEVSARFAYEHRIARDFPDTAVLTMHHVSGAISVVGTSWTTPSQFRLHLQATGGNLSYELDHRWWTDPDVDDHGTTRLENDRVEPQELSAPAGDPLREQLEELAATVSGRGRMQVSIAAGLATMTAVEAGVASANANGARVLTRDVLAAAGATEPEIDAVLLNSYA